MTDLINNIDIGAKHKLTADQIEKECPESLAGNWQGDCTNGSSKRTSKRNWRQNHLIAVEQLLTEAKELCDVGGFDKFRELCCPQLGKSQAYALLAIGTGKKTLAEHRAEERDAQAKDASKSKGSGSGFRDSPGKPRTRTIAEWCANRSRYGPGH